MFSRIFGDFLFFLHFTGTFLLQVVLVVVGGVV
jgi:hypothetical protein